MCKLNHRQFLITAFVTGLLLCGYKAIASSARSDDPWGGLPPVVQKKIKEQTDAVFSGLRGSLDGPCRDWSPLVYNRGGTRTLYRADCHECQLLKGLCQSEEREYQRAAEVVKKRLEEEIKKCENELITMILAMKPGDDPKAFTRECELLGQKVSSVVDISASWEKPETWETPARQLNNKKYSCALVDADILGHFAIDHNDPLAIPVVESLRKEFLDPIKKRTKRKQEREGSCVVQ